MDCQGCCDVLSCIIVMKNNDRFILKPTREPGSWVATDTEHNVSIKFREHQFSETQSVILDGGTFASIGEAAKVASCLQDMEAWLLTEHYDIAMPPLALMRERMGQHIRSIRMQRGLTQRQLAAKAGMTPSSINRVEAGLHSVGLDVLNRIAGALGASVNIG